MNGLGAPRPSLEGMEGGTAKWEQGDRAEFARQRFDDSPTPAVEGMVKTVQRLDARSE